MTVEWPEWDELINESFIPLADNRDRILILKGGRGSSKSDFTAKKFINCDTKPIQYPSGKLLSELKRLNH